MAARVIENERDRLTTILVAPLLTCSAGCLVRAADRGLHSDIRLGRLLSLQGLTLAALYVLGIVAAVVAALVLKRTVLRARLRVSDGVAQLQVPSPRTVALRVGERAWIFLRTAGTLILAVSIVVWAALYYPHDRKAVDP